MCQSHRPIPEQFFDFYAPYLANFGKMADLWSFGLSIQLEYLEPWHESTLRNFIGICSFLKLCQLSGLFARGSEQLKELCGLVIRLLRMCTWMVEPSNGGLLDPDVFRYVNGI